jgi:hypothetical protein
MGELAAIVGIVLVPLALITGAAYFGVRLAMRRNKQSNGV